MADKKHPSVSQDPNDENEFVLDMGESYSDDDSTAVIEGVDSAAPKADPAAPSEATQVVVGRPQAPLERKGPLGYQPMSSEVTLRQAEHLKTAQRRVQELEKEVDQVRRQNEEIFATAETFRSAKETLERAFEKQRLDLESLKELNRSEGELLREGLSHKDKEIQALRSKNQELQDRLDQSFRQVRKREKELEHRLEIMKMDGQAVLRSKDESLLELKEKLDTLQYEKEKLGKRNYALHQELQEKEAVLRRISRALHLALVQLEGETSSSESSEDGSPPHLIPVKKAK